ncbi:6-hydroxymethylpterin diphosphokinase MptE-like protein [Prevotella communis]|uniref:6-hydroxymethylpterin diphosphokinase MptE-like protein n=1 Tax=Prevotella communis TaxID=2913614 RepID=UPI001EDA11C2|nr:6-hydroxymethylpterin diphosphokinase MptE-like protein [Prevotella communis]UKK56816.1 DUF115 domain-containing protein [Prevotella communis]
MNKVVKTVLRPIYRGFNSIWRWFNVVCSNIAVLVCKDVFRASSIKGKYVGKRCFIVCNGPSLRPEDLTKIHEHGDVSVAMNMIGKVYESTPWRPNILVHTDASVFKPKNKIIALQTETEYHVYQKKDFWKTIHATGNKVYVKLETSRRLLDDPMFSIDSSVFQYSIGTTTYEAIEWAVHLGCKEIYLLGCDMSYSYNMLRDGTIVRNESGKDYFYNSPDEMPEKIIVVPTWEMNTAYEAAEKFSYQYGFRVYNATRGGKLEVFERVDIDKLF